MRTPEALQRAFDSHFQETIAAFAATEGLLPDVASLSSPRFISRSLVPHIERLSELFNREEKDQADSIESYWAGANPANKRLAYFLYFAPCNAFRVAAVWSELARLGFSWRAGDSLRALDLGAGPAAGACGIAAGESYAPIGLPMTGSFALIERDKLMLSLGQKWATEYFKSLPSAAHRPDWQLKTFHRTLEFSKGKKTTILPRSAPSFNLWLSSYFLNEVQASPEDLAFALIDAWERHLDEEGLAIIIEPALKMQSRKLLALRQALIAKGPSWLKVMLPCLGHQECGALTASREGAEDWCHDEATWWRPPYVAEIDKMAGLDRKTLPFSYLLVTKSNKTLSELLPVLQGCEASNCYRLVSPSHKGPSKRELEFFVCGKSGKKKALLRTDLIPEGQEAPSRGDILIEAEITGDAQCSRVQAVKKIG
jgi:hypothetical protein